MKRPPRIGDLLEDRQLRRYPERFLVLGLRDHRFSVHALSLSTGQTDWYVLSSLEVLELLSEID